MKATASNAPTFPLTAADRKVYGKPLNIAHTLVMSETEFSDEQIVTAVRNARSQRKGIDSALDAENAA